MELVKLEIKTVAEVDALEFLSKEQKGKVRDVFIKNVSLVDREVEICWLTICLASRAVLFSDEKNIYRSNEDIDAAHFPCFLKERLKNILEKGRPMDRVLTKEKGFGEDVLIVYPPFIVIRETWEKSLSKGH